MAFQVYWLVFTAALGAVVGSFLNVCVYRLPWEKSIVWPGSHCPSCLNAIRFYDNIPILSWFILRGKCRSCGTRFSPRYMLVEAMTAALFGTVFWVEVLNQGHGAGRFIYHIVLISALIVATFIDLDLQLIPDSVTIPVTLFGLAGGAFIPGVHIQPIAQPAPDLPIADGTTRTAFSVLILAGWGVWAIAFVWLMRRREVRLGGAEVLLLVASAAYLSLESVICLVDWSGPATDPIAWPEWLASHTRVRGFGTSLIGLIVGAGLIELVRLTGTAALRKEAMGFGDVTLMAMVGSYLGWQPAVLVFFIAPFLGLVIGVVQWLMRGDNVIPYGPYLGIAAAVTCLTWDKLWPQVSLHFELLAMAPAWLLLIVVLVLVPLLLICFARNNRLAESG